MSNLLNIEDTQEKAAIERIKLQYRELVLELADSCDLTPSKTQKVLDQFLDRVSELCARGGKVNMNERGVLKGKLSDDGVISLRWLPRKPADQQQPTQTHQQQPTQTHQ